MAMHRKTTTDSPPPPELLEFDPDDWPGPPQDVTWHTWWPAFERWCAARHTWDAEHPRWLGRPIEQLQAEHQTRMQWMQRWPLESMGRVDIHNHVIREGVYDPVTGLVRGRVSGEEDIPAGGTGTRYCDWLPGI